MMTAVLMFPDERADFMARASGMVQRVKTLLRSLPGMGGRMGDAPVASTRLSYGKFFSSPVDASEAVTHLFSLSILVARQPVWTVTFFTVRKKFASRMMPRGVQTRSLYSFTTSPTK